ncbi:uncharacterized protein NP_3208A [Natronomonas pharaonis DSM 2160]|uniref:KEOPS complex Pcc1-like subunit n=1 Tax=Natronomonas pharaonis (strain ATCC 35678 / DSM 2160 / CIP 103997 / JCM 8858 / NBRC 14720 / NCIMB 2260 / Gabara) TaxID=348780 RepID=A0A1U7EX49_NATPD|nr:KEOPS complex subunit Pcc1 [Natronomonas pharaonis]CAI49695.1 uncharacterized protein NP_3208A [Natronomonas pharaonis DSM 2160]
MTQRRLTIRTDHDRPEVVAAAVAADNTAELSTHAEDGTVETTIERETTGGLRTTADDYVCNLIVAQQTTDTTTQS